MARSAAGCERVGGREDLFDHTTTIMAAEAPPGEEITRARGSSLTEEADEAAAIAAVARDRLESASAEPDVPQTRERNETVWKEAG